ncbi:MAG: hypothetical protein HXY34_02715 [Candidatus Thorarchaeota archaeon]|nr:hypothetical protein [Candidatus Thorarchaeota archaeon]
MLFVATNILGTQNRYDQDELSLRLIDMLSLPKTEVIRAWREAAHNQSMVKLMLDLLGHDIRNYSDANLKILELIRLKHPNLESSLLEDLADMRRIEQQSIDLVDNILTLGRIQGAELEREPVNLFEMFNTAMERTTQSHGDVTLIVSGEEALKGITVRCHPLLEMVFYNILSNMAKHRRQGCQSVHVDIIVQTEGDSVKVVLIDDGPGISDEDKISVFDSLKKRPRHKRFGLYLVKAIQNQLGCEIWIENRPDSPEDHTAGTAFHLRFPLSENKV